MVRNATVRQARSLRRRATVTERYIWRLLRDRRLGGLKFRRQVPMGPYVLDFVCFEHALVLEADGPFHDPEHDAARDAWLLAKGPRVIRLPNEDACSRDLLFDCIFSAIETPSSGTASRRHLLPQGEKGTQADSPGT